MILNEYDGYHMMDWWFDVFGPYWWIFMVLGWAIIIATSIIIAYYVHKDALKRGIDNAEMWLIITLIFNVVGLLVYLLVRKNYKINQSREKESHTG
ncbi:MAG: hypothetical protein R6U96_04410 [Promethearchaeia archaeon]